MNWKLSAEWDRRLRNVREVYCQKRSTYLRSKACQKSGLVNIQGVRLIPAPLRPSEACQGGWKGRRHWLSLRNSARRKSAKMKAVPCLKVSAFGQDVSKAFKIHFGVAVATPLRERSLTGLDLATMRLFRLKELIYSFRNAFKVHHVFF